MNKPLFLLDCFAGIGGFPLAAQMAGVHFDKTYFSEVNPYAIKVYKKNFPDAIALGDITKLKTNKLEKGNWCITGGFPCQDISSAGSYKGIRGARSGLWFDMLRVIHELQPQVVIIENVAALSYRGLDRVLLSLSSIRYDAEWRVLSAQQVNAPHLRKRMWIVATPSDSELHRCKLQKNSQHEEIPDLAKLNLPINKTKGYFNGVDWASVTTTGKIFDRPAMLRIDDGLSEALDTTQERIIACGNAIVPQCAEVIFRQLVKCGLLP